MKPSLLVRSSRPHRYVASLVGMGALVAACGPVIMPRGVTTSDCAALTRSVNLGTAVVAIDSADSGTVPLALPGSIGNVHEILSTGIYHLVLMGTAKNVLLIDRWHFAVSTQAINVNRQGDRPLEASSVVKWLSTVSLSDSVVVWTRASPSELHFTLISDSMQDVIELSVVQAVPGGVIGTWHWVGGGIRGESYLEDGPFCLIRDPTQ